MELTKSLKVGLKLKMVLKIYDALATFVVPSKDITLYAVWALA